MATYDGWRTVRMAQQPREVDRLRLWPGKSTVVAVAVERNLQPKSKRQQPGDFKGQKSPSGPVVIGC